MMSMKYSIMITYRTNDRRKFENTAFVEEIISYDNMYSND